MESRGRRRSDSEDDRTLFAKGLCYNTTEETLVETFGAVSARIPLNNQGRSKGFAYIEFETETHAEDALEKNDNIEIDGWTLILDYVGRKRKNYEEAAEGGSRRGRDGASGGGRRRDDRRGDRGGDRGGDRDDRGGGRRGGASYGFSSGGGRGGRGGGGRGGGSLSNKTLYVKGISPEADEDSLMDLLGCSEVRIPRYHDSDENKGFAYADFADHQAAQDAIDQLNEEDGLFLEFARERGGGSRGGRGGGGGRDGGYRDGGGYRDNRDSRDYRESRDSRDYRDNRDRPAPAEDPNNKTLYVKGISYDATEDTLVEFLGCNSVRIPLDRDTQENKGFAYADFEDHSAAQAAIESLSGDDGLFLEFARERGGGGRRRGRGGYGGGRRGGRGYNDY